MSSLVPRLVGFAICFAVGLVLMLLVCAVQAVLELPHELVADASSPMRWVIPAAGAFAILCALVRATLARQRSRI